MTFRVRRPRVIRHNARRAIDIHCHYGDNRDRVCRRLVFRDFPPSSHRYGRLALFFSLPVILRRRLGTLPRRSNPVQNWPHQAESGSCGHWQNGCSARLGEFFIFFLRCVNVVITHEYDTYEWYLVHCPVVRVLQSHLSRCFLFIVTTARCLRCYVYLYTNIRGRNSDIYSN